MIEYVSVLLTFLIQDQLHSVTSSYVLPAYIPLSYCDVFQGEQWF